MAEKVYNVLFLCTGNSARSIMAEVMLNHLGHGRFNAYSAGSHPNGKVNPLSVETLASAGLPTRNLRSKSWDEFAKPGADPIDFIVTVCDNAAAEVCPGVARQTNDRAWGVADPAAVEGSEEKKRAAFRDAAEILRRRIELLVNLPIATLDRLALQGRLGEIGKQQ